AVGGEPSLELLHLGTEDVHAAVDHPLDRRQQLALDPTGPEAQGHIRHGHLAHRLITRFAPFANHTWRSRTDRKAGAAAGAGARRRRETPSAAVSGSPGTRAASPAGGAPRPGR